MERPFQSATPELLAILCIEWKTMDYGGFVFCKASSSILLVQNAPGDLISVGQRLIIRACAIFLLCVDRAVNPSLHGSIGSMRVDTYTCN